MNVHFIKANIQQLLKQSLLAKDYKLAGWWGPVSHGLMLLGLVAPLTTKGIGTILIAATHTKDFKEAWGSDPLIDNNVAWANVKVIHDGYELSRLDKLRYIIKQRPEYLPNLRVCYNSHTSYNCGRCEKCLQTITALTLEGIDPRNCGFKIDGKTFSYLKDCLIKGRFYMVASEVFLWTDLQKHIPEQFRSEIQGAEEFFAWLKEFDLSKYKVNKLQHFLLMISLRAAEEGVAKTIGRVLTFTVKRPGVNP